MTLSKSTRKLALGLLLLCVAYSVYVSYIFLHRHLDIPAGDFVSVPTGTYFVTNDTNYQIPGVFRGETLTITDSAGSYSITDGNGNILSLTQGADGFYFSENFSPVGAWILPGIARNWNEGRVTARDGILIVEGQMLEMGLMLFIVPFKDVTGWQVELTRAPNKALDTERRTTRAPVDG